MKHARFPILTISLVFMGAAVAVIIGLSFLAGS